MLTIMPSDWKKIDALKKVNAKLEKLRKARDVLAQQYQLLEIKHKELGITQNALIAQLKTAEASNEELRALQKRQSGKTEQLLISQHDMISSLDKQLSKLASRASPPRE